MKGAAKFNSSFRLFLRGIYMENKAYPSNSYKSKTKQEEPASQKKNPVVTGKVTAKKTGMLEHLISELIPGTASEIGRSILDDILIPGIRDGIHGAIDTVFGGNSYRGTTYASSPANRINYSGISRGQNSVNHSQPSPKRTYEFESLTFATRSDAEAVLSELRQHIYAYDMVRVSDLFEFADVSFDYTAQKYGWTDLSTARVYRAFDGWKIDLPRAIVLD